MENRPYTYEEILEIGQGSKGLVLYDSNGREKSRGATKGYSYYNQERGTYSIFAGRKYLKMFKAFKLSEILEKKEDIANVVILRDNMGAMNMILFPLGQKKACIPASRENIYAIIRLKPRSGKEFLDRMIRMGIIAERTDAKTGISQFFLSPMYGMEGTELTLDVYLLFREQLDPHLSDFARQEFQKLAWISAHGEDVVAMKEEYEARQKAILEEQDSFEEPYDIIEEIRGYGEPASAEEQERVRLWISNALSMDLKTKKRCVFKRPIKKTDVDSVKSAVVSCMNAEVTEDQFIEELDGLIDLVEE